MPTVKIAEPPPPPCAASDHFPPSMMVYSPGTYEHTCSSCGAKTVFTVPHMTYGQAQQFYSNPPWGWNVSRPYGGA